MSFVQKFEIFIFKKNATFECQCNVNDIFVHINKQQMDTHSSICMAKKTTVVQKKFEQIYS